VTVDEAINELLARPRSDDETVGLIDAARASMRIRELNSQRGGAVLAALHQRVQSWREVERLTGIPHETARRWALPPDYPNEEEDQPKP
jgi:hypothetical protein